MQNLARDEAGNVWELDASGNAVRMVESAAPAQGRVFSLPQSPKEARQEQRQDEADRRARREQERADEKARREQLEWDATHNPDGSPKPKDDEADPKSRKPKLDALATQIKRVESLYNQNIAPEKYGIFSSVGDFLPTEANSQFNTAAAGVAEQGLAAFRVPGVGSQSDTELRQFVQANKPTASNYDTAIEEKLRQLKVRVDADRKALGMEPVDWDVPAQQDDGSPVPVVNAGTQPPANDGGPEDTPPENGPRKSVASGDSRTVFDARASSQVDAMLNAGATDAMINEVLKRQGYPTIRSDDTAAARAWMRRNPGKRYFGANISRTEDLNLLQKAAGSDTGAFLTHMANTATAGIPAALAGPEGQGALDAMAANSPNAAGLGGLTGAVTGVLGGEAAIAARAPAALAQYAPRIADTLYGGLLGFNQAREGEGGMGALTGAGAGLVGGVLGERAMRGLGRAARGVTDPAVQYLRNLDIPLTVGQTVGGSGVVGRSVKKVEDALTSLPFVGNMVDARRMEGIEGFNRAAFDVAADQVGGNITDTGAEGIQQLRGVVGQAYRNTLDPVRIDASDGAFISDLAGAQAAAARIPDVNGARGAADAALDARISGAIDPTSGEISGRNFQEAYRGLARTGRERANSDYGHEIGGVMRQGQDALAAALERQNPGAFEAFRAANATNRNANVLAEAVNKAKSAESELFTPAQLNMADASSARRLTGPLASAAGERPFHGLATAGQAVLPSRLPDSGTSTRALTGLALGGGAGALSGYAAGDAATGTGAGLGATLLLAAGGSRPAQRALVSIFADRPDLARKFGDILIDNAGIGGGIGAGTSAALLTAP